MKKNWAALFFLMVSPGLFSLDKAPWLGDAYEFDLYTDINYSQYSKISNAIRQPAYSYNNYVNDVAVGLALGDSFDVQIETNLARTPHQTYGFRSAALQGRYLLFDDIAGDPVTLNVGLNTRAVTGRAVRDVSSPYASYWNGEATVSVGKEFTKDDDWKTRGYLFTSVGLANHGSFWNQYELSYEARFLANQAVQIFSDGYFGYGNKKRVDINHFRGWGFVRHRSIDVGARYCYMPEFWGTLSFSYACRVWAYSYPQKEQIIQFSYNLPFSPL